MAQKTEKFDFKKEAKKTWNAIVRFVKPYSKLDKALLLPYFEGFLKKNINTVYLTGSIILLVFAVLSLWSLPYVFVMFSKWIAILLVFVVFRLLCELIATSKK